MLRLRLSHARTGEDVVVVVAAGEEAVHALQVVRQVPEVHCWLFFAVVRASERVRRLMSGRKKHLCGGSKHTLCE
jgi:hypothetical protein